MKDEKFEALIDRLEQSLANSRKELLDKISYYGDKGPNIEFLPNYGEDKNAVFIGWVQTQWERCFEKLDALVALKNRMATLDTLSPYENLAQDIVGQISRLLAQQEQQAQLKQQKTLTDSLSPIINTLDSIFSMQQGQPSLYKNDLSEVEIRLSGKIEAFRAEVNKRKADADTALEREVTRLQCESERLKSDLKAEEEAHANTRAKLNRDLAELNRDLTQKREQLLNFDQQLKETQTQLGNQKEANQRLSEANTMLRSEKQSLEKTCTDLSSQITNMKETHEQEQTILRDQLEEKVRIAEARTAEAQNKANNMATELQRLQEQLQETTKQNAAILRPYEIYRPVLTALEKCDTFRPICEKYALYGEMSTALFTLVQQIGASIDFVKDLYDCAVQKKQQTKEPMTDGERQVYAALNLCCRSIWGVDFDIYRQPGGQSINTPFQKVKFDFAEARNLTDSRDRGSKFAQELYVPALCARTGNIYSQAQVKAGNL